MKSRLYIACLIACSGAPPVRDVPRPAPRDASIAHDALATSEPDADTAPLVCEPYDEKNPACKGDWRACTEGHADCKCSHPPDVNNPACWAVMACPAVPDRRVRACLPKIPPCADGEVRDDCPPAAKMARVIKAEASGGKTVVTIGLGADAGITKSWQAMLLRGETEDVLAGGELTILRIGRNATVATVSVTLEDVQANPRVRFAPRM